MLQYIRALVAQWIVQTRPKGTISVRFRTRALDSQEFAQFRFVEADDEVFAHRDDGHAHLPALLYHLLALSKVRTDIVIGECDAVRRKEILRRVAEVTGRSRVNCYLFFVHTRMLIIDDKIVQRPI